MPIYRYDSCRFRPFQEQKSNVRLIRLSVNFLMEEINRSIRMRWFNYRLQSSLSGAFTQPRSLTDVPQDRKLERSLKGFYSIINLHQNRVSPDWRTLIAMSLMACIFGKFNLYLNQSSVFRREYWFRLTANPTILRVAWSTQTWIQLSPVRLHWPLSERLQCLCAAFIHRYKSRA